MVALSVPRRLLKYRPLAVEGETLAARLRSMDKAGFFMWIQLSPAPFIVCQEGVLVVGRANNAEVVFVRTKKCAGARCVLRG